MRPRRSGSHRIPRWREVDSNFPVPRGRPALNNTPKSSAMSAGIFARVTAPQEFALGLSQLGTDSSNPSPSSGESCANLSLAGIRLPTSRSRGFRGCAGRGERRGRQRRAGRGNIVPMGGNISVGLYSSTAPPVMWAA